jgi:hypothetical protein
VPLSHSVKAAPCRLARQAPDVRSPECGRNRRGGSAGGIVVHRSSFGILRPIPARREVDRDGRACSCCAACRSPAALPRRARRGPEGNPERSSAQIQHRCPSIVRDVGPRLRQAADDVEVQSARDHRARALPNLGTRRLHRGHPRPSKHRPSQADPGPHRRDARPAGQRSVAPAHPPRPARQQRRARIAAQVLLAAPADRLRLLPVFVASVRREPKMELRAQRGLRRPRRARVHAMGGRQIPTGRQNRSTPTSRRSTAYSTRWPTCSARSATTSAYTKRKASPRWTSHGSNRPRPGLCPVRLRAPRRRYRVRESLERLAARLQPGGLDEVSAF